MIADLALARDHAAFLGHFPGFPVLPGAVLLDEALHEIARSRALDLRAWRLASVKFHEIVRPGDPLTLEHDAPNETTLRFTIRNAGRAVASGLLATIGPERHRPHGG